MPPTPVPPPRREGRRYTVPTPADLRRPGSPGATAPAEDEHEPNVGTPDLAAPEAPDADASAPSPPVTIGAPDLAPADDGGPATPPIPTPPPPAPPAPRNSSGPTPGTLPRRGGNPVTVADPTPPAVPSTGVEGAHAAPDGATADSTAEAPAADDPGEGGARRMFPNPATLMAAGRGVRKVRPGALRGRRLPKVEETSAGGVVLDLSSDPTAVALIARHDRRSRLLWSLPKGHVEEGETPEQAALREVFEETGLVGRIVAPLGVIDFWFVVEDKRIHKTVHHYVIEAVGGELSDEDIEVEAVEWIPFHQVVRKLAYGDERRLVEKVPQIVPGVK